MKLDFDELLLGREVPEYIGVGMPVTGFGVSSPDAFLNTEVSPVALIGRDWLWTRLAEWVQTDSNSIAILHADSGNEHRFRVS